MLSTAKSSLTVPTTIALRLEQDLIVGIVRDSAAGGDRGKARAAPAAQHAIDFVSMEQRAAPAATRGKAITSIRSDR